MKAIKEVRNEINNPINETSKYVHFYKITLTHSYFKTKNIIEI